MRTSECDRERVRPSVVVPKAIAAREDVEPAELDPLYEVVNPDALDTIFDPHPDRVARLEDEVRFRYQGHLVTAKANGRILVDGEIVAPHRGG